MIIIQASQKAKIFKFSFLFKQSYDQELNQTLQEVQPILTEALNTSPELYSQIKQQTFNEVQQQYGDEAVDEVKKMFEQFEIEYMEEQLESMRPLLEIALVFGGQSEIEKVEEELVSQLSGVLEEGAIEVIRQFFQSVYQTQLLKKLKLLKQEAGNETFTNKSNENFSMEQEFYEIVPILTEILNNGLDNYAQIKQEALAEIQQQNGDEAVQQSRELFQQFETNYIQKALEKMRPQFEYIKEHEGQEGILSYEKAYVDEITSIFEPAAVEELQKFFQELFINKNHQKIKVIDLWGWSDFTDWAKGAYDKTKDWAQDAYNDTKEWSKSTYEKGKELINTNSWIQVKINKLGRFSSLSKQVFIRKIKQTFSQEELNQTLQEVQPILTEALNTSPELYSQIKQQTFNEVQQQYGDEAVVEVKKMFEQFEIEYMEEQLESMRPLLEIALVFGGQSEIEKVEEELVSQLSGVLEEGAIEVIKQFFQSVYQTQLLKKLKLLKQEAGNEENQKQSQIEKHLEEMSPMLTEALDQGFESYSILKQQILDDVKKEHGDQAIDVVRQLFEQFEIDYTQQILEELRPSFEEMKAQDIQELKDIEQAYLQQIIPIFEPAAVQKLEQFFQNLSKKKATNLTKNTSLTKEKISLQFKDIREKLLVALETDKQKYINLKLEFLSSLLSSKNTTNVYLLGRQVVIQFEVEFLRSKISKSQQLIQQMRQDGFLEAWADQVLKKTFGILEFESLQQFTEIVQGSQSMMTKKYLKAQALKKQQSEDEIKQQFQAIEGQLLAMLETNVQKYYSVKTEMLQTVLKDQGEEAYNQARQLFVQLEILYIKLEFQRSEEEIAQMKQDGSIDSFKNDMLLHFLPYLEFESFEELQLQLQNLIIVTQTLMKELSEDEVVAKFEEAEQALSVGLEQGPDAYNAAKEEFLLTFAVNFEGYEVYMHAKELLTQFEIGFFQEQIDSGKQEILKLKTHGLLEAWENSICENLQGIFEEASLKEFSNMLQNVKEKNDDIKGQKIEKQALQGEVTQNFALQKENLDKSLNGDSTLNYYAIKRSMIVNIQKQLGNEGLKELKQMFKDFEVQYLQIQFQQNLKKCEQTNQLGTLEEFKKSLLVQVSGVFESQALEEIEQMFQNLVKVTQLFIKMPRESQRLSFRKLLQLNQIPQSGVRILIPQIQIENETFVHQTILSFILILLAIGVCLKLRRKKKASKTFEKLKKREAEELLLVKEL